MSVQVDPRAASAKVVAGPADLVGDEIVAIEPVVVDGVTVGVPRLMPGAAEWATVTAAEASADAYREAALDQLDRRGATPTSVSMQARRSHLPASGSRPTRTSIFSAWCPRPPPKPRTCR